MITSDPIQVDREIRLALTEVSLLADQIVGDEAGLRLLGLDESSDFAQSRHPDMLPPARSFRIGQQVDRLQAYVLQQHGFETIADDIKWLRITLERVFSPAVLAEYALERETGIAETGSELANLPGPMEPDGGEIPLGYFHRGLLMRLVELATARLKVDLGDRLTIADLALLTGKREATVTTTAYRKVFVSYEEAGKRYVEVADAMPWLLANSFVPTERLGPAAASTSAQAHDEEYVFVPVSKDGSTFTPSCGSGGRYTIGEKGAEQKYDSYDDALTALQHMPTPRWRRPAPSGVPSIVTGIRFERLPRRQIDNA